MRKNAPDTDAVASAGETWFPNRCVRCHLKAHKPSGDRFGWDYLVEHPSSPDFDLHGHLRSFFQVKTTSSSYKVPRLKLSALNHLVNNDQPCFIIHLTCDDDLEITSARVYHVEKRLIDYAIRSTRKQKSRGQEINRVKVSIPLAFGEDIDIRKFPLDEIIARHVPSGLASYAVAKAEYRANAGFDDETISIRWKGGSQAFDWNSRTSVLSAANVSLSKSRYGITLPDETITLHDAEIFFTRHADAVADVVVRCDQKRVVVKDVSFYRQFHKGVVSGFLLSHDFFDLRGGVDEGTEVKVDLLWKLADIRPLSEVVKRLRFICLISRPQAEIHVLFDGKKHICLSHPKSVDDLSRYDDLLRFTETFLDAHRKYGDDTECMVGIQALFESYDAQIDSYNKIFGDHLIERSERPPSDYLNMELRRVAVLELGNLVYAAVTESFVIEAEALDENGVFLRTTRPVITDEGMFADPKEAQDYFESVIDTLRNPPAR